MNANRRKRESKDESFVRLATARVNKISVMIRKLGNCSTVSNYHFTEEQVKKIFNYLQNEINKARRRFDCALHKTGRFQLESEPQKEYPSIELALPNGGCLRAKAIDDEEVYLEFGTNRSPCIIKPIEEGNYIYMILPIKMKE